MKKLHLICKRDEESGSLRGVDRIDAENHIWTSGKWDIKLEDAKTLIGGTLYLHQSKSDRSNFGGTVLDVEPVDAEDRARSKRVKFIFKFEKAAKGVKWEGADHSMASYSGIIEA